MSQTELGQSKYRPRTSRACEHKQSELDSQQEHDARQVPTRPLESANGARGAMLISHNKNMTLDKFQHVPLSLRMVPGELAEVNWRIEFRSSNIKECK